MSPKDRLTVARARKLERFLTQPFFTTTQFTNIDGKFVPLEKTIDGCNRIIDGELDTYSEKSVYMIGTIYEARK